MWDAHAELRRQQIESGNDLTFSELFLPYYRRTIEDLRPESVLEVGCGTGHLAMFLSSYVEEVVAIEPSQGMFRVAADVLSDTGVLLHDITLDEWGDQRTFDLVVSHMCVQAIDNLGKLFAGVRSHMTRDAQFLFSIPHPCFYNDYKGFFEPATFEYMKETGGSVSFSISLDPQHPIEAIPYYHRPLSVYFGALRQAGLRVADFHELLPSLDLQTRYGSRWCEPRYCVFISVLGGKGG